MSVREQEKILVKAAIELTTMEAPRWEYLAARLQNHFFSRTVREEMQKQNIQTFPESFQFVGGKSDVNSMIGNAVPVNLAKYVGSALMRYITSNESRDNNEGN